MIGPEIEKLILSIAKLPGLGQRSAQRIALYLLRNKEHSIKNLINVLEEANNKIIICSKCFNIDTINPCSIFSDKKRDNQSISVV